MDLVGGGGLALVEPGAKRVLNPDGVGQVGEGVGVAVRPPDTKVPDDVRQSDSILREMRRTT